MAASREDSVLRAINYARLHLAAGDGLETVVHALATAGIPGISRDAQGFVQRGEASAPMETVLAARFKAVEKKPQARAEALLYGALAGDPAHMDRRLDEAAREILSIQEDKREKHQQRVKSMLTIATIVLALSVLPPIANFMSIGLAQFSGETPEMINPNLIYMGGLTPVFMLLMMFMSRRS